MTRLYTIKEASQRTGLSTQLIRKWEERYEAVTPSRFPNGYRGYTREDIETLQWLKIKSDQGVPIGLAVQECKHQQAAPAPKLVPETRLLLSKGIEDYRSRLMTCLLDLDAFKAHQLFDQLSSMHQMDFVLLEVVQPVLVAIGEGWESGEISEFQEHFSSHFLRDRLLALRNLYRTPPNGPLLVTACAPMERHELGILFLVLFALQYGFRIVHLGTCPSEKGVFDCLQRFRPAAMAFGTSSERLFREAFPFFCKLDKIITECGLPTRIFVGGSIFTEDGPLEGTRHVSIVAGDAQNAVAKLKKLIAD